MQPNTPRHVSSTGGVPPTPPAPAMPLIPRAFLDRPKISQALQLTVQQFDRKDQSVIYLYCLVGLTVKEINTLTKRPITQIRSILLRYAKYLEFTLGVFKKAIPYDPTDTLDTGALLALEADVTA